MKIYQVYPCENVPSGICGQRTPRWACASVQSDHGLRCPQTKSLDTIKCFTREQMPGWDFAHVQGDVNPQSMLMLEGTFSLDATYIKITTQPSITCRISPLWLLHLQPGSWKPFTILNQKRNFRETSMGLFPHMCILTVFIRICYCTII